MRALCGAIITAGAAIGLGLTAIGVGTRAGGTHVVTGAGTETGYPIGGGAIAYIIVLLTCVVAVGLGIAFLGLAYHHHRRHHEFLREHGGAASVAPRM